MIDIRAETARLESEMKELAVLVESTETDIARLREREEQAKAKVEEIRKNPTTFQREDIFAATDELHAAAAKRTTMEAQLAGLMAKRKLFERVHGLLTSAGAMPPPVAAPAAPPRLDESKLLQAVVDTQEEERRRIARQVHDGPAQAMANVVLQSEISERLYEVDQQRSRSELAALRQMVNKTLQELRGFIFELRPMILDDLGLVPTLRRYVQTLVDKHAIKIDFASTGRDRRLGSDDEVAIFRLIQDSLIERIEKGGAKGVAIQMDWKDTSLDIVLSSDGRDLPTDSELTSGLRRSERVELLKGTSQQETRPDGRSVVSVRLPLRAAPLMVS